MADVATRPRSYSSGNGGAAVTVPSLYKRTRLCCACGLEVAACVRSGRKPESNMIAIIPYLYYKGGGKRQTKKAAPVNVCVQCLVQAIAGGKFGIGFRAEKIWKAIRQSISERYSSMVESDELETATFAAQPPSSELFRELFLDGGE